MGGERLVLCPADWKQDKNNADPGHATKRHQQQGALGTQYEGLVNPRMGAWGRQDICNKGTRPTTESS